jgi:hypothetical protein
MDAVLRAPKARLQQAQLRDVRQRAQFRARERQAEPARQAQFQLDG